MARCTSSSSSDSAGAEHALGPAAEAALDGFFDFRKQAHGWISPSFTAALTISAAAGAAAVPPYTPFSTRTENAILRAAAAIGREADEPGVRRRVGQFRGAGLAGHRHAAAAARRPVPPVTTSRMKRASVAAASGGSTVCGARGARRWSRR